MGRLDFDHLISSLYFGYCLLFASCSMLLVFCEAVNNC